MAENQTERTLPPVVRKGRIAARVRRFEPAVEEFMQALARATEGLSAEELDILSESVDALSNTNCWFGMYMARDFFREAIRDRRAVMKRPSVSGGRDAE